jgi:hypothetical protein
MPDETPGRLTLPTDTLADKASTWLGAAIIGLEAVPLFGTLIAFGFSSLADFAFMTFSLALVSTLARHLIRIDRAEDSENYEYVSLKDRWHFSVPRRLPPPKDG